MLLKILIIAALMYFALRAVQNLSRAVRLDQSAPPPRMEPRAQTKPPPQGRPPQRDPYRPESSPRARPLDEEEDIEDARWEDL